MTATALRTLTKAAHKAADRTYRLAWRSACFRGTIADFHFATERAIAGLPAEAPRGKASTLRLLGQCRREQGCYLETATFQEIFDAMNPGKVGPNLP